jgi:hypothetical protein
MKIYHLATLVRMSTSPFNLFEKMHLGTYIEQRLSKYFSSLKLTFFSEGWSSIALTFILSFIMHETNECSMQSVFE